jgi:signal transduction histidine kinase
MVSPVELAQDSVQLFREKAAAMNIQLDEKANPGLPDVRLDAAGIRRMLHDLIWNALEACHNDKEKKQHLVNVEKVVNKHGGRIEVISSPDTGTTFKIILKF